VVRQPDFAGRGAGKAGNLRTGKERPITRISEAFSYEAKRLITRGANCSALTATNNAGEENDYQEITR
jgi:hypothetical protein